MMTARELVGSGIVNNGHISLKEVVHVWVSRLLSTRKIYGHARKYFFDNQSGNSDTCQQK